MAEVARSEQRSWFWGGQGKGKGPSLSLATGGTLCTANKSPRTRHYHLSYNLTSYDQREDKGEQLPQREEGKKKDAGKTGESMQGRENVAFLKFAATWFHPFSFTHSFLSFSLASLAWLRSASHDPARI